MIAEEVLGGCTHKLIPINGAQRPPHPCRACALRAVEAAREEERAAIERVVECANGCNYENGSLIPTKYGMWINRQEVLEAIRAIKPNEEK